jgi:NADH-quinone oxidoreductase subunit C
MADPRAQYKDLARKLSEAFPDFTVTQDRAGIPTIAVPRERYVELIQQLRSDHDYQFTILSHLNGVQYPGEAEPFEVVVHLTSMHLPAQVAIKVRAGGDPPTVPSLAAFWTAANWHEREVFDMFGIVFAGHPDPRRIYLEEDADFHPLRKDYPVLGRED